jgi:folate-dependent phosphoribosylglycinamide formyltransferase PurN
MDMQDSSFRVTILAGVEPAVIARLIEHVGRDVPGTHITGVLYVVRPSLKTKERVAKLLRRLGEPGYVSFVLARAGKNIRHIIDWLLIAALRFLHAYSPPRDRNKFDLDRLAAFCKDRDIPLLVTSEIHADESLKFVRDQSPDLGVVFGAPILKPKLFEIPRLGSINVHQRKVPDYRGGGPVGLWEMLDGQPEIGVTIHRVLKRLDAGAVIGSSSIPIGPFDTLESLGLKAHVVSIDLLSLAISDFARQEVREIAQSGPSRMYRSPDLVELRRHLKQLAAVRPAYVPHQGWPTWKLVAKMLLFGPLATVRNWRRRLTGTFPIVVLFHHVITDRPHFLGMPTSQFLRHLGFLHLFYDVVDLETAVSRLRSGRVDSPMVVLTFDDGYNDNALTLRAVSLKHDVRACLFVCPRHITEQHPFEHDTLRGEDGFGPLSWEELKKLGTYGYQIASHTQTHFDCGSTDPGRLRDEIVHSRIDIEESLGHPVPYFSFPFGHPCNISRPAIDLAKGTYDLVCSAYGGENLPHGGHPEWHVFRRSHPDSVLELELSIQSLLERKHPPLWTGGGGVAEDRIGLQVPEAARSEG